MCHGENYGSVNLQPFPSGCDLYMFVVKHISEGGTESDAAPPRRPALVFPCKTADRDVMPRGTCGDEREAKSRHSGDMGRLFCPGGQLSSGAASLNGFLAQLQSGDGPCILLADSQEPGAGELVVEWSLIRDQLDKINRLGGAEVSAEAVSKALLSGPTSLPSKWPASLCQVAQGLINGQAPKVATEASESTSAQCEVQETVPADDLTVGRSLGCVGLAQDVRPSQSSAAAVQPCASQRVQPDGKRMGMFGMNCDAGVGKGEPVMQMQGMCLSQPKVAVEDAVLAITNGHKADEPTGLKYGQFGTGPPESGDGSHVFHETYPGKAGEVKSMVDELLSATSSALDTNLRTSTELSSLTSKFQSLLDDIHALQNSVGSEPEAPQPQGMWCKDSSTSMGSTPMTVKACNRTSSQEMDIASISSAGCDSGSTGSESSIEHSSGDWDVDALEAGSSCGENASCEDMWSEWSYDAEELVPWQTSALAAITDADLNLGNTPCIWRPSPDVGVREDPIPDLASVSSDESLTCLVEQDTGLVSLCRDDPLALAGAQRDTPILVDCMRSMSPPLKAEEIGHGTEDCLQDYLASLCNDKAESCAYSCSSCDEPKKATLVTSSVDEADETAEAMALSMSSAKEMTCGCQEAICLNRGNIVTTDKGFADAPWVGTFNHFEGFGCWEAKDQRVGLCMGSDHAEMIHGCADEKALALVCTGHIGCSMTRHNGYAESSTCPMSTGGHALNEMEVIAPHEQWPQEWSRVIITDLRLFLGSLLLAAEPDVAGCAAMVLASPCSPAGQRDQLAALQHCAWNMPHKAHLALADGYSLAVRDLAVTTGSLPPASTPVLGSPRGCTDVRRLSLMTLHPGAHRGLLGIPTDSCIHLDSPLNMPWFSSSQAQVLVTPMAELDDSSPRSSHSDLTVEDLGEMGEQVGDSSDDDDTIGASVWEADSDCTALRVAGYRLNSCDLAAWGSNKQGLSGASHWRSRASIDWNTRGLHRPYDRRGICALQIAMERPTRGAGGRLQHGMCIHNTGAGQTCVWCTPAWKQKADLKNLMDTGAQNFWKMCVTRTQNACKFFLHWWTLRVGRRFHDFQFFT